jgi:hypothetical protein
MNKTMKITYTFKFDNEKEMETKCLLLGFIKTLFVVPHLEIYFDEIIQDILKSHLIIERNGKRIEPIYDI